MSEAPLPNDEAARSPTGEILDARDQNPEPKTPETPDPTKTPDPSTTKSPDSPAGDPPPKPEDKPAEPPKAPDAYTDFTVPDGYQLDKALLDKVTPIFKELGLSQEAAQKLVSLQVERDIAAASGPQSAYETLRKDWQGKTLADTDISAYTNGDKSGIDAVKIDIGRALNVIGDPALVSDFRAAMDLTGAGDHPAFVKALWRLAQHIGEGKPVSGKGPSPLGQKDPAKPSTPSAAQALYPNLPSAAR